MVADGGTDLGGGGSRTAATGAGASYSSLPCLMQEQAPEIHGVAEATAARGRRHQWSLREREEGSREREKARGKERAAVAGLTLAGDEVATRLLSG